MLNYQETRAQKFYSVLPKKKRKLLGFLIEILAFSVHFFFM